MSLRIAHPDWCLIWQGVAIADQALKPPVESAAQLILRLKPIRIHSAAGGAID